MAFRRIVRLEFAIVVPTFALVSLPLTQCSDPAVAARDAGGEPDATVDGEGADDAGQTGACGNAATFCATEAGPAPCDSGWNCAVDLNCPSPTMLTGKVFDPAGRTPLANVVVFVPNKVETLPSIAPGAPTCEVPPIGDYVAAAVTDGTGSFVLRGVPLVNDVPVTVQIGKWRRTVTISVSKACGTTPVSDGVLHLPGRRTDGDMPQMALLTGGGDNLACLLAGIGVDPTEFTAPQGGGRVAVYRGVGGADLPNGGAADCTGGLCPLWDAPASLDAYDVVLLSCEGGENRQTKPAAAVTAMHDWLLGGGHLFGVHYETTWFANGPPDFQRVADWVSPLPAAATGPFRIDSTAAFGHQFRAWATAVGIADADGGLALAAQDVATSMSRVETHATGWFYDESTAQRLDGSTFAGNVKALSVGLPDGKGIDGGEEFGVACGRAVLTDVHPGGVPGRSPIPSACPGQGLSAADKALEFLFFDDFVNRVPQGCGLCPPPLPPLTLTNNP